MYDFLIVVRDNALAITTLVGVFTIIGGFIGVWIKNKREKEKYKLEKQKIEDDKKSLRQQMITNNIAPMRQLWINDLRSKVSDYLHTTKALRIFLVNAISKHTDGKIKIKHDSEIYHLFVKINQDFEYIDLLLPFSIESELDKKEKLADEVRDITLSIRCCFEHIIQTVEEIDIDDDLKKCLIDNINSILTHSMHLTEKTKLLLLQEWRVTKSLKEIE